MKGKKKNSCNQLSAANRKKEQKLEKRDKDKT
jgi:hypothetical protein